MDKVNSNPFAASNRFSLPADDSREAAKGKTQHRKTQSRKTPLHRIREVCEREGISDRSAARHMGVKVSEVKRQQREDTDLLLRELSRWQEMLDVPITELLEEPQDELSATLLCRARLVQLMKSARSIEENARAVGVKRMAQRMVNQLLEMMPELSSISAWHSVGQRRGAHELGRILERQISEEQCFPSWED